MRTLKMPRPAIAAILLLAGASPVEAGSAIMQQLASLDRVSLSQPSGLQYEPIPGLDRDELRRRLLDEVVRVLADHNIEVSDNAQSRLFISLSKEKLTISGEDVYAIGGDIRLVEWARLERHVEGKDGPEKTQVTTWKKTLLVISAADAVLDEILHEVKYAAELFAGDVVAAKHNSKGKS